MDVPVWVLCLFPILIGSLFTAFLCFGEWLNGKINEINKKS